MSPKSKVQRRRSRFTFHTSISTLDASRFNGAFTLVAILIAIGILAMVLTAIFSSWTAILRATKVGLDAAAAVQRARIVIRTLEDSLLCAESFDLNQRYYGFLSSQSQIRRSPCPSCHIFNRIRHRIEQATCAAPRSFGHGTRQR